MQPDSPLPTGSNRGYSAAGVSDPLDPLHPQPVGHAEEKIAHRPTAELNVPTRLQGATPGARQNDREIIVRVPVAVGVTRSVNDHRIVQHRATVDILRLVQTLQETREMLHVVAVDPRDLPHQVRVIAMMRTIVVSLGDTDLWIRTV